MKRSQRHEVKNITHDQENFLIETFKLGWSLFERDDNGDLELCALDDPDGVSYDFEIEVIKKYEGEYRDREAASDCQRMANEGNLTCRKAIECLIAKKSPDIKLFDLEKTWE